MRDLGQTERIGLAVLEFLLVFEDFDALGASQHVAVSTQ